MADALIRGTRLHYERAGSGPPLLMLHGIGSNGRSFRRQMRGLRDACTAIAMDARGYGRSADPKGPFLLDDVADDAAALLDHLGCGRAAILGHSMGGVVAQLLYQRHPDRVAALILADTNPGSGSLPEPQRSARVQSRLQDVASLSPRQIAEKRAPNLTSPTAPRSLVAEMINIMAEIRPATYRQAAIEMGSKDVTDQLPRIRVPTLILCGELDAVTPPTVALAMARAVPRSRLVIIPGAGHASNQEKPRAFNAAVRKFLAEMEPGAWTSV